MKCRIVVFDGADFIMYRNFGVQLFLNLSFQRLLCGFSRLDFTTRKFPLAFVVAIAAGGGINFMFRLNIVADHSCNNANNLHDILLLT